MPPSASAPPAGFLNVVSTKRSGHHAFIDWIRDGSAGPVRFINNAVIDPALLGSLPGLARSAAAPAAIVMNYEGVSIPGVSKAMAAQAATGAAVRNILFVRDPLNACASLLQRKALRHAELVMVLRQLFALRNWLKLHQGGQFVGELVFYNRWLADEHYRESLAERLSISPARLPDAITSFGGGSSFQDLSKGGEGAAPHLLRRWKRFADDRLFRTLVTHPHFCGVFLDEVSGAVRDAMGESDEDTERAAYLEAASRQRRRHPIVDRVIEGLIANEAVFERIEALPAGLEKRLTIAKAHIGALLSRPRRAPADPRM
ncbi:MAG: hypothetical protein KJZ80_16320 [Hyphomicrobiaceae bacterium]|nr:hypothetical protein [Hyphomicrobiaceae bacterium]